MCRTLQRWEGERIAEETSFTTQRSALQEGRGNQSPLRKSQCGKQQN